MRPFVFAVMALVLTAAAAGAIEKPTSLLEPGTRVRVRLLDALPAVTAEDSLGLGRLRGGALHVGTVRVWGPHTLDLRG